MLHKFVSESELQYQIRLAVSSPNIKMFRNNVGCIEGKDGRRVTFGLCVGSSDLIGWTSKTITQDDVGKTVAVFTALEVKTPTGKVSPQQQTFIDAVNKHGGIGAIVRSVNDAVARVK